MNPYAIRIGEKVVTDLTYANASEQVRLYGAQWVSEDAALVAIAAERAEERAQVTVSAKDVR